MGFFLAAMRWFIGKYWLYLLAGGFAIGLGLKLWFMGRDYEQTKQLEQHVEQTERVRAIAQRPRGDAVVIDRLLKGRF